MIDTKIDISSFDTKIKNDLTGRPAYNPRTHILMVANEMNLLGNTVFALVTNAAYEKKIDTYIPDQNFRKRDIRFKTKRRHVPSSNEF